MSMAKRVGNGRRGTNEEFLDGPELDAVEMLGEVPGGLPEAPVLPKRLANLGSDPITLARGNGVEGGQSERCLHRQSDGGRDSRGRMERLAFEKGLPLPEIRRGKLAGGKRRRGKWEKDTLTKMMRAALLSNDGEWARRVINGLLLRASRGNPGAQKIVFERCDGVLKKELELSGSVGVVKEVVLTDLREPPRMPELEVEGEVVRG